MEQPQIDPMTQYYMNANQMGEGDDPNSLYADNMREEKVNNIIQQLNPDNLVEDIEHRIRGQRKNRFTGEWEYISSDKSGRVSELLISRYISFLSSILNQSTALSNYTNTEINNIMEMIIQHVKDDLKDNSEEYGFVMVNEITVDEHVKIIKRKVLPNGKTAVLLLDAVVQKKKIVEEVTDYNEMTRIGMIILTSTFSVFKRALNGSEARRIFGALKVNEALNSQGQPKKGIWDALKFWA